MSRLRVCRPGEHRPLCPSGWERRLRGSVALRPFRVCAPGTFTRVYCSACGGRWRRGSPRQALAVLRVLWESVHLSGQLWAWGHRGHGSPSAPWFSRRRFMWRCSGSENSARADAEPAAVRTRAANGAWSGCWWPVGGHRAAQGQCQERGVAGCSREADCSAGFFSL